MEEKIGQKELKVQRGRQKKGDDVGSKSGEAQAPKVVPA